MDAAVDIPEPTKEASGAIKAIAKDTVNKICSGQVVLSLAVAVKELVENSLDAGATLVEVKLRDHGSELIEVSDNGSGVEENNLEAMTAKYHTSKIREFADLLGVESFGFRGEALSSLCALSDMTISTRNKASDVGTKIELDHEGKIRQRSCCARSIGTTVSLTNLFGTLPVRKRDFNRNIKKEFNKMCQVLQSYCLVSTGVRIILTNQSSKGGKIVVMQTHGAKDVLSNISSVFGPRQLADIVTLQSPFASDAGDLSMDSMIKELDVDIGGSGVVDGQEISGEDIERLKSDQFRLEGYVSSCSHGSGRSSKDRQYFYINSRPCDPKNVAKLVNEVYHRYNVSQHPFIYLNVTTPRSQVDVNLTPDKRQLLVNNEKILLLTIKRALLNTYGSIPSTYKIQNSTITSMFKNDATKTEEDSTKEKKFDEIDDSRLIPISTSQRFMDVLSQWKRTGKTDGVAPHVSAKRKVADEVSVRTMKLRKIQEFLSKEESVEKEVKYLSEPGSDDDEDQASKNKRKEANLNRSVLDLEALQKESKEFDDLLTSPSLVNRIDCKVQTPADKESIKKLTYVQDDNSPSPLPLPPLPSSQKSLSNDDDEASFPPNDAFCSEKIIELDDGPTSSGDDAIADFSCAELRTSLAAIELNVRAEENFVRSSQGRKAKLDRLRFKSEIRPSQNQNAEEELQKEIAKESFARMEIVGQFNLGFIIVKLEEDLFIVDQHATDEKYNFEMLQRSTEMQYQKLAVPQTLEMTAVNEMILLDHREMFEKNGFRFEINENAPATRKVRLVGKPFSKNWEFGKQDIDELIFMLQDAPEGTICRPSRIRDMFASRACRKSVMIGKALSKAAMKTLITHMGEIEQPWNCPHGRPTMRHLINTAMLLDDEEANTAKK